MKRLLKITGIIAAILLLLLVGITILARLLITPERIKAAVIPRAEAALGRKISLEEVDVRIFTGIRLNRLTVHEVGGREPFVAAESVALRYQLWPLFFKRIVIDEIRLVKPGIRVERLADGSFNFGDLLRKKEPEAAEATREDRGEPIDLLVAKIEVSDGRLLFIDHRAGGTPFRQEVTELNLTAREISLDREFPFDFGARVNDGTLKGEGAVNPQSGSGRVEFAVASLDLAPFAPYLREKVPAQVNALRLDLKMKAEGSRNSLKSTGELAFAPVDLLLRREGKSPLHIRNAALSLNYAVSADLSAATLEIEKGALVVNRIPLQVTGRVADYATAPNVNLRFVIPELALEEAVKNLPPELAAPLAELQPVGTISGQVQLAGAASEPKKLLRGGEVRLASVSVLAGGARPVLSGRLKIAGDALRSENLQMQIGESRAAIDLQVENLLGDIIRVRSNLRSERFALDPLLQGSAATAKTTAPPPVKNAAGKKLFPLAMPIDAEGGVAIGETVYKGLQVRDFSLRYRLQNNVLTVHSLDGKVANGTFAVTGQADLGRVAPAFTSRIAVQGIQAEPLLNAFYPRLAGILFGTLDFRTQLNGQGSAVETMKKTISAEGAMQLADGRITGARLLQGLADFLNLEELREIRFDRSEGSFTIRQGKLSIDSDIKGRNLRLQPQGTVNLDGFRIDLALNMQLAPELAGRLGRNRIASFLTDETGWAQIPVRVGGTLDSPRFTLDRAALGGKLRERTGEELRRKLRKELDRRFPSGNGKPEEGTEQPSAEELLRGLFGR